MRDVFKITPECGRATSTEVHRHAGERDGSMHFNCWCESNSTSLLFTQQQISNRQRETLDISLDDLEEVRHIRVRLLRLNCKADRSSFFFFSFALKRRSSGTSFRTSSPTLGGIYRYSLRQPMVWCPKVLLVSQKKIPLTSSCGRHATPQFKGFRGGRIVTLWLNICFSFAEGTSWGQHCKSYRQCPATSRYIATSIPGIFQTRSKVWEAEHQRYSCSWHRTPRNFQGTFSS